MRTSSLRNIYMVTAVRQIYIASIIFFLSKGMLQVDVRDIYGFAGFSYFSKCSYGRFLAILYCKATKDFHPLVWKPHEDNIFYH